jgi:hypothetical protein
LQYRIRPQIRCLFRTNVLRFGKLSEHGF